MKLVTRSDFDGLCCGAVLKHKGIIDSWEFVHPKDMQDGTVNITSQDVLANVPLVEGCALWFDHHATEIGEHLDYPGQRDLAPSCARVVYEYYGGESEMPHFKQLIEACDKVDSGQLTADEIQNPEGGVLLGFLMDPRTGLGRIRQFRISNLELMLQLIDSLSTMTIEEVLETPDVQERIVQLKAQEKDFKEVVIERSYTVHNVLVTDMRGVDYIPCANRFMTYSMYPDCNVSLWVVDGRNKKNAAIAIGHSITNRTCKSDIGNICKKYNGGGHPQVGTCQVEYMQSDWVIDEIVGMLDEQVPAEAE